MASEQITDAVITASIPQTVESLGHEKISDNAFFAFMMVEGVSGSEAQRSLYESLDERTELTKTRIENYQDQMDAVADGLTTDNLFESDQQFLEIQQKITGEKRTQEQAVSMGVKPLANRMNASLSNAYSFLNSLLRVTGIPARRA